MAKRDEKATRTAQGNRDENDRTEEQGTEDMVRDEKAVETGDADEKNDVTDDMMAELSEDELAELAELEEFEEIALLEELEALEELDELDGAEEAWLAEDEADGDEDEGNPQEGIPTSDGLADGPDGQQGETDRTEETDEVEDPYDQIVDGYIYLITNLVNGKKYVGQTTKTIEERWRQHVYAASIIEQKKYTSIMDMAIAKYGEMNFSYEEIEHLSRITRRYLDQRECYWIAKYRTCIKDYGKDCGYNLTHGGHSCLNRFSLNEELEMIHEIHDLHLTQSAVAKRHKTTNAVVRMILQKHGIEAMSPDELSMYFRKRLGNSIEQLDENHNVLRTFNSSYEAADWLQLHNATLSTQVRRGVASTIRTAAYTQRQYCGYYWHIPALSEEERVQHVKNMKKRKPTGDTYYARKGEPDNLCPVCGQRIGRKASFCREHARKALAERQRRERLQRGTPKLNGIPIMQEELVEMLRFNTVEEIAAKYGVSGNGLKKFARTNFDMKIKRQGLFRFWNSEYECYEYSEHLPFTVSDLIQFLHNGGTYKEFAKKWKITYQTLCQYLRKEFGLSPKEITRLAKNC